MNFFIEGGNIGLSITTIWGLLFIFGLSLEIASYSMTRILFIHRLYLLLVSFINLRKLIPNWWKVSFINPFTIKKYEGRIIIHVVLSSKIKSDEKVYYFIHVNWLGKIINSDDLLQKIVDSDKSMLSEIRDYKLNKIKNL